MRVGHVNHSMTVWAHRSEIIHWIDFVLRADGGQRIDVVNVNEPFRNLPVSKTEIKPTYDARTAVNFDAPCPRNRTALVGLDDTLPDLAFAEYFG